ncbi:DUF5916 domain-containing protein [Bizionia paragorgiae]|uniref:DUF5916 domain-containing protein n=1 Tax=Bizionia paragorgiae TaxID=283786 RepID=UPI003A8FE3D8
MKYILWLLFIILIIPSSYAQSKKEYTITRALVAPKIDGILNDAVWQKASIATDFIQFRPTLGKPDPKTKRTEVKMAYDDTGIYISAYLYDNKDDIMRQFNQRDVFGQNDFFGVVFNPNNDAQNNTEFFVFPTGNQADANESPSMGEDFGWNSVWESAVNITSNGWVVELKIPYRCLRFTKQDAPIWGIQFHRHFRKTNEQSTWNPVDLTTGNSIGLYNGTLVGLKNIDPPTRLNLYPYASALVSDYDGVTETDFAAGLDVKYGITENITLDATLIPDFSQAGFDDVQLNLGPFEQQFSEQRQFFTEGVDLFNKGNLFYSRRIGRNPTRNIALADNENIEDYPEKIQLLNAIKVSGRTKKGLGIGFFNAITKKTEVTINKSEAVINPQSNLEETIQSKRKAVIEPLSNYNILVLDQQFNKNSSATIINTNVTRNGDFRDANVTALILDMINKSNTYGVVAEAKMSQLNDVEVNKKGYSSYLGFGKTSGKYRFNLSHNYADKDYDINDLGILNTNNYSNFSVNGSYRIFEPTETLNSLYIGVWGNYNNLSTPYTYTGTNVGGEFNATNKSLHTFGANFNWNVGKQYDFFEPRNDFDSFYLTENYAQGSFWISSNYNSFFSIDANVGYAKRFESERSEFNNYWFGIGPRFKFNDKFLLVFNFEIDDYTNDRGYMTKIDDVIVFGQRDRVDIETTISGNYNFNSFNALTLSFRNYLGKVTYENQLYSLQNSGRLLKNPTYTKETIGYNPDINFNSWNLDLSYSWQFAPGSQLTALYRNSIFSFSNASQDDYFKSLGSLFDENMENIVSLKLVYFIDYNSIKNVLKKKSKSI